MTPFQFIIGSLACYRLTIFITRDFGPWGVFSRLRAIDKCSKLLKCVFCVSVYMGLLSYYLCLSPIWFVEWIIYALAFSSVTIMLDRVFTSDYRSD